MTPKEAADRLHQIETDIRAGRPIPSIRERLDLYYLATGTTAADYEPDDQDELEDDPE